MIPVKTLKLKKTASLAISLFLLLAFVFCIFAYTGCTGKKTPELSESENNGSLSVPENSSAEEAISNAEATPEPTERVMIPEMQQYYEQNSDVYGKLRIEGTVIDYLLMYSGDDFYINHNFYRNYQRSGSLYIDKHNTIEPRDTNLIIHGHNMKSGIMFGSLDEYKKKEFYEEHKIINLTTLYEEEEYEIFAVFLSKVYKVGDEVFKYYKFYNAANENEFNNYIENCLNLAIYDTGIVPEYGDELIALSTCDYTYEDGRLVVVARKIKE